MPYIQISCRACRVYSIEATLDHGLRREEWEYKHITAEGLGFSGVGFCWLQFFQEALCSKR